MLLYVVRLGTCMLHKCALYAAIKIIISGSYVSPYKNSWSTTILLYKLY